MSLAVAADGERLYAGTYSGVWRSNDAGEHWAQSTRPQPSNGRTFVAGALAVPNVFDVAVSPVDRDFVLAATANDTRVPDQSKNGVYVSSNGAVSWRLAHQTLCPGSDPGRVGQIVFAPDNPRLIFAAAGCAIAISRNRGRTWRDSPIVDAQTGQSGTAWHVAVAPIEGSAGIGSKRRVYEVGDDQVWYSENGGRTWLRDRGPVPDSNRRDLVKPGPFGGFRGDCCLGSGARIHVVEPGNPARILLAVPSVMKGPRYYDTRTVGGVGFPDGTPCDAPNVGCGGGSIWLGDYSAFSPGHAAKWTRLADPPNYFGGTTPSGRLYIATKEISQAYLLFFSDGSHVHVSEGLPQATFSWHRLDGRDASQSKLDHDRLGDNLFNKVFIHFDPHAIAVSNDFTIALTRANVVNCPTDEQNDPLACPYNQNSVLDPGVPPRGKVWLANDGGVYRSTDGGSESNWELGSGLATLQPQSSFAGVARPKRGPALYFGVPDNDNFFSLDGGATWKDPTTKCGDCSQWWADPAQPSRVLEEAGRVYPPGFGLYKNPLFGLPDASNEANQRQQIPFPEVACPQCQPPRIGFDHTRPIPYRPLIFTVVRELPLRDGDYILIRPKPDGTRVLLRTTKISQITHPAMWDPATTTAKAVQVGPAFIRPDMDRANVVQAADGHRSPIFYVGDPDFSNHLWRLDGPSGWEQIVPTPPGSVPEPELEATEARRFFVDPYNSSIIYIVDRDAIKRSLDGGISWEPARSLDQLATEDGSFSYEIKRLGGSLGEGAVITDMIFDRFERGTRFAIGNAGVFFTLDGEDWQRLLASTALPSHPVAAYLILFLTH